MRGGFLNFTTKYFLFNLAFYSYAHLNLAVDLGKLDAEDSEAVAYIEEISEVEYWHATQSLKSYQNTI